MMPMPEGNAIVYCQGAYATPCGKTAHGLVRRTDRYRVLSVVDQRHAGKDAGKVLDGRDAHIPVFPTVKRALKGDGTTDLKPTHLVVGLAPDGGKLPEGAREEIAIAIRSGLHVDSGLHDYLSEDPELSALASRNDVRIRDIRKPLPVSRLNFFTGRILKIPSLRIAVLGTDSAVGKRTTAWLLTDALREAGFSTQLIGTGQTAWMQGVRYGIILDALVNDFVAGELEHALWKAWCETQADVLVIEGQGSLFHPAYPGGFEILAATRPDAVIMQHAPARTCYDGFPAFPIHPLKQQVRAVKEIFEVPVPAVALNHEDMDPITLAETAASLRRELGLVVTDPLIHGAGALLRALRPFLETRANREARV